MRPRSRRAVPVGTVPVGTVPVGTVPMATSTIALSTVVIGMVAIGAAGCTSSPVHQPGPVTTSASSASSALVMPTRAVASPGCGTDTTRAPVLGTVRTALTRTPGLAFGVAVAPDGHWAFVAAGAAVDVMSLDGGLAPAARSTVPVPGPGLGETVTRDGRYLLVASGNGAAVISVARAEQGGGNRAVAGVLHDQSDRSQDAIEVATSADGGFAFVSEEYTDRVAVFNLRRALTRGFGSADFVGSVPLGQAVVGTAVSPDGRWLYATSELAAGTKPGAFSGGTGTLSVIDSRKAETDPARSVVSTVAAGCSPVRVVTSADGSQVWVTARESDDLLCFSAAKLRNDPRRALVAVVRVGTSPVGLASVRGGTRIVVADSSRFRPRAHGDLAVVDVAAALAGKPAVLGRVPAGQFPREMAVSPDGRTLLVGNFLSSQLETVSVPSLP